MKSFSLAAGVLLALAVTATAQETAKATFVNLAREKNGTATLTQTSTGVLIELEVTGLPGR